MDYIYGNINPIDFNFKGLTSDSVKVIVDNVARTISAELVKDPESIVSLYDLDFYLNDKDKIELTSRVYEWMSSDETFDNRIMFLSVDDNIPSACVISKFIDGNSYEIRIASVEFGSIALTCNGKPEYSDSWEVNLDTYLPPIYNSDFSPYLEINNSNEIVEDTVINPIWCKSFGDRLMMLEANPTKARCIIGDVREICTIYAISEAPNTAIICIQTSKGEYQLTYQFESDPL